MKYTYSPFNVEYEFEDRPTYNFIDECILAAKLAKSKNIEDKPIAVTMSGGIDSEIVANSFLLANIPFTAIIGRLCTRIANQYIYFNEHDFKFAISWCQKNNIEYRFCDIDIYRESGLLTDWLIDAKGFSPQFACHMYILRWCSINGYYFVSGHGDIDIVLKDDIYYFTLDQREFSIDLFCEKYQLNGVIRFYAQNQKLSSALLNLPKVQELMNQKCVSLTKYKHTYFEDIFNFEPRIKQTGFEKIQEWDSTLRVPLKKINGHYDEKNWVPISYFKDR